MVEEILGAICRVVSPPCALHEPLFAGREQEYVAECIRTGWVSSVGSFVDRFEQDLAAYTGAAHAVVTVNGTAALHLALRLAGVEREDEVLVPALSFVASANAIAHCGAVPHFVDVNEQTLGLCPLKLADYLPKTAEASLGQWRNKLTGRRIAAIIPMHAFGHPCDMEALTELASRYTIPIVEDAAESLGSYYKGQHTGTFGLLGVLSFNGNKIVTTGGGGAILTNKSELAKRAKHLSTTAKVPHRWQYFHDEIGFNYRMPNINAALGCAQLERLPAFLEQKRRLAQNYKSAFAALSSVHFIQEPQDCRSNYWLNAIRLHDAQENLRDQLLHASNEIGIATRPCWTPLNRLPMYESSPASPLDLTNRLYKQLVNLPSSAGLMRMSSV